MRPVSGHAYRIRNKETQLFMSHSGSGYHANKVIGRALEYDEEFTLFSQTWYLFTIETGDYIIINKDSGLLLSIEMDSVSEEAETVQKEIDASATNSQIWSLAPGRGSTTDDHCFRVINKRSRKCLTSPGSFLGTRSITQKKMLIPVNLQNPQMWEFIPVDNDSNATDQGWARSGNNTAEERESVISLVPMTTFSLPPQLECVPALIGRLLIPFVLVNDPGLTRKQQSLQSPFYQLHRFGLWKMILFNHCLGIAGLTQVLTVFDGMLSDNAEAVRNTLGISVCVGGKFLLSDVAYMILAPKIRTHLLVNVRRGITNEHSSSQRKTTCYPSGQTATCALWARIDRYVLYRKDGTKILEWTNNFKSKFEFDIFFSE